MNVTKIGWEKPLNGTSIGDARALVVKALAAEGFGVLTETDVKTTLKNKLDVGFRPYVILRACNPKLAHRARDVDPQIDLLLPCNVVVQQSSRGVIVSIASPKAMFALVENAALDSVVSEADERLRRVLDSIA